MDRSRIALIIPAYNEATTIYGVVESASKFGVPIVVDDCSSDRTAELANKAGAIVVSNSTNLGYDGALNSGFAEAYKRGFQAMITLDADGQHDPSILALFIEALSCGADLVLGVRNRKPRIAEHLFAFYAKFKYGIRDPLCGMKAYRRSVYEELGFFDSYKSIGTELAIYGVKKRFVIKHINFLVRDRIDSPRFGRLLSANLKIIRAMILSGIKY